MRRQSYQSHSHSLSVKPTWMYTHITLHKPAQQAQYSQLPKASRLYFTWWNSEVYVSPLGRDWKRAGAMRTGLSMKAGALPRNKGPERSIQLKALTRPPPSWSLRSTAVPQGQARPTVTLPHRCGNPTLQPDRRGTSAWPTGHRGSTGEIFSQRQARIMKGCLSSSDFLAFSFQWSF